jgi:hypothetical protein
MNKGTYFSETDVVRRDRRNVCWIASENDRTQSPKVEFLDCEVIWVYTESSKSSERRL